MDDRQFELLLSSLSKETDADKIFRIIWQNIKEDRINLNQAKILMKLSDFLVK